MATGGHAPGTAQLAATASTRSTPDAGSNTVSSPLSTSIAVSRNARRGHRCDGITRRRTGAGTVSVASATAPMRRNCWRVLSSESSYGSARAVRNSSVMASTSTPESISGEEAATCRSNSASRVWPLHSWAATAEPADVPTSTSDSVSSRATAGDSSAMPRRTPVSQAIPAIPPPASTRARLVVTSNHSAKRPQPVRRVSGSACWESRTGVLRSSRRSRAPGGG